MAVLTGVGAGNFMEAWRAAPEAWPAIPILPVHDVPVLIAAEQGLPTLALWIILQGWIFYQSVVGWRDKRDDRAVVWFAAIVLIDVVGFFDFYFWSWEQGRLMFFTTLGLWVASRPTGNIRTPLATNALRVE